MLCFVNVISTAPSDRTVSTRVMNNHNGTYTIEYTPTEVGTYNINVSYDGMPIPDGPFYSKAYDSGSIVVSQMPNGIVGSNVQFTSKWYYMWQNILIWNLVITEDIQFIKCSTTIGICTSFCTLWKGGINLLTLEEFKNSNTKHNSNIMKRDWVLNFN